MKAGAVPHLSLCKANTLLGEKRAEGRRAGKVLEAQPAHCPPQPRLTRAWRRMGAPTPQSPVSPSTPGPMPPLLLEEGVGRPEGKAGPAEKKLGETLGNGKGKATHLRLGVSGTEAQPCFITSLAWPRGQGPRGRPRGAWATMDTDQQTDTDRRGATRWKPLGSAASYSPSQPRLMACTTAP